MLACLTLLVRNRRSALRSKYLGRQHSSHSYSCNSFPHPPQPYFPLTLFLTQMEGDGGAGAPVLFEHRVSPGARLLTLVGHYRVMSERSELRCLLSTFA